MYPSIPTQMIHNCKWFQNHGLPVNPKKSAVITFSSKHNNFNNNVFKLYLSGEELAHKKCIRNLGVYFDEHLTFHEHVSKTVQASFVKLKSIYTFRNILSKETKTKLSNALILSKVEYADSVYGPCLTQAEAQRLQKVQNCCVRFIFGIKRTEGTSFYITEIECLTKSERCTLHFVVLSQTLLEKNQPIYLSRKLSLRSQSHEVHLRFVSHTLSIPKHRRTVFKSSFSYLASKLYNQIPSTLKNASFRAFKSKIKNLILAGRIS